MKLLLHFLKALFEKPNTVYTVRLLRRRVSIDVAGNKLMYFYQLSFRKKHTYIHLKEFIMQSRVWIIRVIKAQNQVTKVVKIFLGL